MRTIAVINQKGGCGKTTVSLNLASALAALGKKTLLVDMDPQSHCAVGLAVPEDQIAHSIYDILADTSGSDQLKLSDILWQIAENFELAPSSMDLIAFEQQMADTLGRENRLKTVLATVSEFYDYVIVDCPPSVSLLTFNALRAADDVIVPVDTGYFSLHGLSKQLKTLDLMTKQCNQQINVMVLASMYDVRTKMAREILAELKKHFEEKMFTTIINFNTKLKEAASLGQPVCEYDPTSKGCKDFKALASELIATDAKSVRHEMVNSISQQLNAISSSAHELLAEMKPQSSQEFKFVEETQPLAIEQTTDEVQLVEATSQKLEAKLADFYGYRQQGNVVTFSTLYPRADAVQIAGDFNDWQPEKTQLKRVAENGQWQIDMPLKAGSYHYRLVVDGQWQQDPYNETAVLNPFGEYNSILQVS